VRDDVDGSNLLQRDRFRFMKSLDSHLAQRVVNAGIHRAVRALCWPTCLVVPSLRWVSRPRLVCGHQPKSIP